MTSHSQIASAQPSLCGFPRRARLGAAAPIVVALGLLTAGSCKSSERPLREVTLGLSWIHQAQFSGPYHADQHGLYAKEGLRVTFVPASIDHDPLDDLIAGKFDFVIAQPDTLIAARLKGHKVKAVAVTYRIHPLVFLSLASSNIAKPEDLRGKTIGLAYSEKLILMALLKKMNIDPGEVTVVDRSYDIEGLKSGTYQVQAGWATDELQTARRAGLKLNAISPYDYGITFYADVLTVRESLIEQDPELVTRFVRATLRGWTEALADPEASAKLPLRYNPKLDPEHETQVLNATAPLVHTGVDQIGWMRAEEWEAMIQSLFEQGVIAQRLPASDLYTTRFLEAARQQ
jgi:NitT/TauT family transport system substrate-binding protein